MVYPAFTSFVFVLLILVYPNAVTAQHSEFPRLSIAEELRNPTTIHTVADLKREYKKMYSQKDVFEHSEADFNRLGFYYLEEENRPKLAIAVFTINVNAFPESANAYDSLAEALYETNALGLAEDNYLKALNLDLNLKSAWKNLAKIYRKTQNHAKAEALFHRAISSTQFRAWGHEHLGDFYLDEGEQAQATRHYLESWRITNKPDGAFNKLLELEMSNKTLDHTYIANLYRMARIQAPYLYGMWQGEVASLRASLNHARLKQTQAEAVAALPYRLAKKLSKDAIKPPKKHKKIGLTFTAMGCGPYSNYSLKQLESHLKGKRKPKSSRFSVHLGDIFNGKQRQSTLQDYQDIASLFQASEKNPFFFLLGDNDWNDQLKPSQSWAFWQQTIGPLNSIDYPGYTLSNQAARPENFSFKKRGVRFIGINQVGGAIHDPTEWANRIADNGQWIKDMLGNKEDKVIAAVILAHASADVFEHALVSDLQSAARAFGKPILFLHADGHKWEVEQGKWAPNITRVQTDSLYSEKAKKKGLIPPPPVSVYITPSNQLPFVFDRHLL